jgi:uncharacterized iron-regulated membrane protein
MNVRRFVFWLHLISGCVAGAIILLMSVTGVLLTYERQILAWLDRGDYRTAGPPSVEQRLSVEDLLAKAKDQLGALPSNSALVIRSNLREPAELSKGREGSVYFDAYTGKLLGESFTSARRFFQQVTSWHRWLGTEGEGRATARAITGACNLAFLFIIVSGPYLWLPRKWTKQHLRPIVWFRGNLSGKARDFNWHNVIGLWSAIPLFIVVLSAVPMSYTWANDALYRLTGSEPPPRQGPGSPARAGNAGPGRSDQRQAAARTPDRNLARRDPVGRDGTDQAGERRNRGNVEVPAKGTEAMEGLNGLWQRAESQVPGWTSISVRLPDSESRGVAFTIDSGDGGQPQKRATLVLNRTTGEVMRWEPFQSNNLGRRLRTWARFAHTGEYYGILGQTIAGIASLGAVVLVWTGISLALRRYAAFLRRNGTPEAIPEPELASVVAGESGSDLQPEGRKSSG